MIPINFITLQRLKCVYFTRYEVFKFNNCFTRIAAFRRNTAYLFAKNEFLEIALSNVGRCLVDSRATALIVLKMKFVIKSL
jgi:hypothetical protein